MPGSRGENKFGLIAISSLKHHGRFRLLPIPKQVGSSSVFHAIPSLLCGSPTKITQRRAARSESLAPLIQLSTNTPMVNNGMN